MVGEVTVYLFSHFGHRCCRSAFHPRPRVPCATVRPSTGSRLMRCWPAVLLYCCPAAHDHPSSINTGRHSVLSQGIRDTATRPHGHARPRAPETAPRQTPHLPLAQCRAAKYSWRPKPPLWALRDPPTTRVQGEKSLISTVDLKKICWSLHTAANLSSSCSLRAAPTIEGARARLLLQT